MVGKRKASKWRAVLAGCGGMSRAWMDAIAAVPNLEMAGLVDIHQPAAEKLAAERSLSGAVVGSDVDAVLAKTGAELLFVCSVPEAHKANILSGLRHGCHVLTEKPLTATMAEAQALVAAAREAKRIVAVTQNYRYRRPIRSLKKFLASGKIGRITGLDVDFYIGAHFGGFRDVMEHVLLLDMSIHPFDMARFLAGRDPVAVTAYEWNPPNSWYRHGASAIATFEFQDGVVFNYRGSWCSQGFTTDWNGSWRILGERGSVLWNGTEKFEAEVVTPKKDVFLWPKKPVPVPLLPEKTFPKHQHTSIIVEFLRCIEEGREPETTITDNIRSLAMVHGAIASAAKGRRVTF